MRVWSEAENRPSGKPGSTDPADAEQTPGNALFINKINDFLKHTGKTKCQGAVPVNGNFICTVASCMVYKTLKWCLSLEFFFCYGVVQSCSGSPT